MLTLPIRFLTCVPRIIINAYQEENPLRKYLVDQKVSPQLLESEHVHIQLEWVEGGQQHWQKENETVA